VIGKRRIFAATAELRRLMKAERNAIRQPKTTLPQIDEMKAGRLRIVMRDGMNRECSRNYFERG
jgi:hypothetical protein